MKRRLFALALALLLAVSLPVSALARDWYIDEGDITIRATENGQTVKQGDKDAVEDAAPVIKQKNSSTSTDRVIKVIAEEDATANVTLDGVNINTDATDANRRYETAFRTEGEGDVNIELDGSNTLRSGYYSKAAGLNKGNSGTLTINDEDNNGKLEATGGYGGAGIGGGRHSSASDITITGGTITARGSYSGAGIGGGASDINGPYCNGSNITIPAETSRRSAAFTLPGLAVVRLAAAAISRSPTAKSPQRAATRAVPESAAVSGPAAAISRSRAVKLKPPAATLLPGLAAAMAATGPTLKFPAAKSPQKAA